MANVSLNEAENGEEQKEAEQTESNKSESETINGDKCSEISSSCKKGQELVKSESIITINSLENCERPPSRMNFYKNEKFDDNDLSSEGSEFGEDSTDSEEDLSIDDVIVYLSNDEIPEKETKVPRDKAIQIVNFYTSYSSLSSNGNTALCRGLALLNNRPPKQFVH